MNNKLRYCSQCNISKKNTEGFGLNEQETEFHKGYLAVWDRPMEEDCPFCRTGKPVLSNITFDEFQIIGKASNYNRQLLDAMVALKEKDIIEYELKLGQFRMQVEQRETQQQVISNQPKCPRCGSTAITAGQRGYSIWTGFLGSDKTVNRCGNCGHKWKP